VFLPAKLAGDSKSPNQDKGSRMDFLNKSFRQLVDLFQSMTPGARVTTSLLLVAIVASLLYLFRFQPDRADEYLFGGTVMTQSEIVAMEAAFGKGGLSNFEIVGNRVRVPRLKKSSYLAALAEENALPESAESAWLDMFASESPFDGKATREHKARFAQEKQLGHIISRLGGIEIATVKIDEQQAAAFGGVKTRQALVAVKPLGSKTLDESFTLVSARSKERANSRTSMRPISVNMRIFISSSY
jgi:hypothetical protein